MPDPGILTLLSIGVLGGLLGAKLFLRFKTRQMVGYIVIGVLLGSSGLNVITLKDIEDLRLFNLFALGIIGFIVGGQLQLETFRRFGRQFLAIFLGEGLLAFLLVGVGSGWVLHTLYANTAIAAAGGVVFGAIASATDPSSTSNVLWEYRSRGPVTTAITSVVALDDALAMALYGFGTGLAFLLSTGNISLSSALGKVAFELIGALVLGAAAAWLLSYLPKWLDRPDKTLGLSLSVILLVISISAAFQMDVILATMMMGFCLVNFTPLRSRELFQVLRGVSSPIFVIFIVMVGARLSLAHMPGWLWGMVLIYVLGRTAGKVLGAWLGAKYSKADSHLQRFVGMGLFAQGGVAIGLAVMASQQLQDVHLTADLSLGDAIIFSITLTTLIMQLIGPKLVKRCITLAGEIGHNVTDEDVIEGWQVKDVMMTEPLLLSEAMPIGVALDHISESDTQIFPVTEGDRQLVGMVTLQNLKAVLADSSSWTWLLVTDVMETVDRTIPPDMPLADAIRSINQMHLDQIPVVDTQGKLMGLLDHNHTFKQINHEVIRRQHAPVQGAASL